MKKLLLLFLGLTACVSYPPSKGLVFKKDSKIAFVGNGYAERMRLFNYLEAAIQSNQPTEYLVFRNLGMHGDQVNSRSRGDGKSLLKNLSWIKPDVVFAFFGMNESFQGEKGLNDFGKQLNKFLRYLKATLENVEIILVSPIAHEYISNEVHAPKYFVKNHNKNLKKYVVAMKKTAQQHKVKFVDLFNVSEKLYKHNKANLTYNGIHQNELGDFLFSREIARSLGWYDGVEKKLVKAKRTKKFLKQLYTKNYYYFMASRPTNKVHLWGGRYKAWAEDKPLFELEQIMRLVDKIDLEVSDARKPTVKQLFSKAPATNVPELWETIYPDRKDFVDIEDIKIPREEVLRENKNFFKVHQVK